MVFELLLVTALAGAAGPIAGRRLTRKTTNLPVLGKVSPMVLGTLIVAGLGIAAWYFRDKLKLTDKWADRAKIAGVASLGAFTAIMAAKYDTKKTRADFQDDMNIEDELETADYQATGNPEERVLDYSRFTGNANPTLTPNFFVTVKD